LFKVIEDLQSDKSLNSLSEADISLGVVLRILDALSWSTYDHREVSPEYSVENRWTMLY
jgi:predicted type IV restriction endonuclease